MYTVKKIAETVGSLEKSQIHFFPIPFHKKKRRQGFINTHGDFDYDWKKTIENVPKKGVPEKKN